MFLWRLCIRSDRFSGRTDIKGWTGPQQAKNDKEEFLLSIFIVAVRPPVGHCTFVSEFSSKTFNGLCFVSEKQKEEKQV